MAATAMDERIRDEVSSEEKILWTGQPRQGFLLRGTDAFLIPFSVLWGGFAIFWEATVLAQGAPLDFALWGIPFVLIGLYFMFGRFWVDTRQRAGTVYAVTSERVLIISGLFSQQTKSLNIDTISDLSLTERSDGTGTITFGSLPPWYAWYGNASWPGFGHQAIPTFDTIIDARSVYEIIRGAQRHPGGK